jgi:hypothetical protein
MFEPSPGVGEFYFGHASAKLRSCLIFNALFPTLVPTDIP